MSTPEMTTWRVLTLRQPWLWIVMHLGKTVENRSHNLGNFRGPLLLHASARMTADDWWGAYEFVRERFGRETAKRIPKFGPGLPSMNEFVLGSIAARCIVTAQCGPGGFPPIGAPAGWDPRWYMGKHAWIWADVKATEIVPCAGALGFWRPPARVLDALGLALDSSVR